ncbi:MAG: OAM dimerization domain-containing protein [Candidatus Lernaella stagnicola]|nr:OAM dimerization domain-containing protein [Candidatus Lernaella stagnicola]
MPESKVRQVNLADVRPYGDAMNDGAVQMSFTLPVPLTPEAIEAARLLARELGLRDAAVQHSEDLGGYSFFVVYGHTQHGVDMTQIHVEKVATKARSRQECNEAIEKHFGRKLVIIGACIGTDAHTVGIDAIMNMKGYDGHYGLERFVMVEAKNLGAQVPSETLLREAMERNADAVLVSQVVTEKGFHKNNLTRFVEMAEAAGCREQWVLVCGGPRVDHKLALELGYDAGFGRGTHAEHVCSFVIDRLLQRKET